jgi:TetR/AcrR family transcriptional regulator, transcriptional repressor for nem operon
MRPATVRSHQNLSVGGKVSKGEQTRQEIIRKAAPLFNQKGYEGTALSDLMEATGLEKGGIYGHFDSKQELAEEVFDHAWKLVMDTRFEGVDEIANSVDRLQRFLRNFRERRVDLVSGGCPLVNTAIESDDGNPQLRNKACHALHSWLDRLKSIAEEGQRKGEIRSHVDAEELATLIITTLEGSLMVSRLEANGDSLALAYGHFENYLEANVCAGKSKSGAKL